MRQYDCVAYFTTRSRFNVENDRGEHHELSHARPDLVQSLLKRLQEVSLTGTQGAHLCPADNAADNHMLHAELNRSGAYLPYAQAGGNLSLPWTNDLAARSCYNP
jgi:hypothetical protein